MIKTFRMPVAGITVAIDADDSLAEQANWMLRTLAPVFQNEIKEGDRFRMGWSSLTAHLINGEIHLYEPDFRTDPFRDENPDVSLTLQVTAAQTDFLHRTGMQAYEDLPFFAHKLILQRSVLERDRIAMLRRERVSGDDSGWFVVPAAETGEIQPVSPTGGYEAVYSYQLLRLRPAMLIVLGLPAGCVVVFNGSQITSAVDPQNHVIWPPSAAAD